MPQGRRCNSTICKGASGRRDRAIKESPSRCYLNSTHQAQKLVNSFPNLLRYRLSRSQLTVQLSKVAILIRLTSHQAIATVSSFPPQPCRHSRSKPSNKRPLCLPTKALLANQQLQPSTSRPNRAWPRSSPPHPSPPALPKRPNSLWC
jgi:hypothetical protein